jgi:hypothetical protein
MKQSVPCLGQKNKSNIEHFVVNCPVRNRGIRVNRNYVQRKVGMKIIGMWDGQRRANGERDNL